ncbi:ATP-dependent RNA helicase-like protein DB10 [Iris pallida]|uniref:RNA helicase n=1 Tax=Iris pallida TaxID=29817 RepID=A0AAX6DUZ0_IRIPA|nr:ATP-dependent RNA helicase-like protein DB10 [Iris pallida]
MATAEAGPSYAPEDPTLPKPWKGLIDGSTGVLYYWNPETNATQYEKPGALAPPPLAAAPTPNLAPIPTANSQPPNNNMYQHESGQQIHQQQPMYQMPNQQAQHIPNQQAQHYPQMQMNQMVHPQFSQPTEQLMSYPQNQQQQGRQFSQPTEQLMSYPQNQQQQGPQSGHQLGQQNGFPVGREQRNQEGDQVGYTAQPIQRTIGSSGDPNYPGPSPHVPPVRDYSGRPEQQIGGLSSISRQHSEGTFSELHHVGLDATRHQQQLGGPVVVNPLGHSMARPPMGPQVRYGEDQHGTRNDYYSTSNKDGQMIPQQHPRLATIPHAGNQQDRRMGAIGTQNVVPGHSGGSHMAPEFAMSKINDRAAIPNLTPGGPSPRMAGRSDFINISGSDAYCKHHEITAVGDNVPAPFTSFEATGFPPEILREIHSAGFPSPTPIQAQTWPIALQSRDIVAIAKTGSGKTLGYLIPAFIHLRQCRNNPQIGPTVLVLSPTRELATQIQEEVIRFGRAARISCTCLYGGAPKGPQLKEIERGVDIVVATPGRLNDILEMKRINFCQVSLLVLDEADRMLDMGFEPQIRKIVNEIPPRRQTLMYTATWPKEVRKIAGDLLVNPVQVNIGNVDELVANKSITQYVELVPPMEKQRRLEQILRTQERGSKIIIFCSTKRLCDQLARGIGRGFGAAAIHGDKSQVERDHVLNQFRSGRSPILVATDVAARGLDIKDIRVVINYDFPTGIEDYVHRIGRTGRAGATGISYTFLSDQDWKHAAELVKLLEGSNQRVPPEVREMAARGAPSFSRGRGGPNRWDSGGGRGMRDDGGSGGRWDSNGGGRGMRDGNGGRRWDSGSGHEMRGGDGGGRFGGRGGGRNDFGGRGGGRNDFVGGGRGSRGGHNFGGPPGGRGWQDRSISGRGRFDGRRGTMDRNRDRSYSRSPERVRTRGYSSDDSRGRSRSRSRSWSRSRSRSRSQSRSRSRSPERPQRARRPSGFDVTLPVNAPPLLPPGQDSVPVAGNEPMDQLPPDSSGAGVAGSAAEPIHHAVDM